MENGWKTLMCFVWIYLLKKWRKLIWFKLHNVLLHFIKYFCGSSTRNFVIDPTNATCKRIVGRGGSQMTIYCQDFHIDSINSPRGRGFVSIQERWMNFVSTFLHPFLPFIKYLKNRIYCNLLEGGSSRGGFFRLWWSC